MVDWDDILYLVLLISSVGIGHFYRNITDSKLKQITGTLIGLGIVTFVSGLHIVHVFIFVFINIYIILFINKKTYHLISLFFSFFYLIFFRTTIYFGIPYPPAHTNIVLMMLTMKLVGVAFELNTAHSRRTNKANLDEDELLAEIEYNDINVNFMDIFHYSFNYIGVLTGPYYTYRTYLDSLHLPYFKYASCQEHTVKKLMCVVFYCILFLSASHLWPLSYALSDDFYLKDSVLYRLWYVFPTFYIFRMRMYIGMTLSECICSMAGLGAYPNFTAPKPGKGPSTNFIQLKKMQGDESIAKKETYNFEAIHNINPYEADFCVTFRDGMKVWNMCVQYWLAVNIYKRFPSKKLRTLVTMFVSAVWHGVYIGHYFTICGAPFYLLVEDLYFKLFLKNNTGESKVTWEWIIWIMKMSAFSYLGFAFQLLTVEKVFHYYNSIYHIGTIVGTILYVIGIYLLTSQKSKANTEKIVKQH